MPTTIKVQIQLQGAEQTPTSKITTLHHQIVYRLQNHALDLPTPHTMSDALMILADTDTIPTIFQNPKQIQKQELLTLMPLEWLTNYKHFHQNFEPVQTTEATFERRKNGQVKLSFQTPNQVSETPTLSETPILQFKLVRKRTFQSMVFLLKGIMCTLTNSMVTFYGIFLKPICAIRIVLAWMIRILMMN